MPQVKKQPTDLIQRRSKFIDIFIQHFKDKYMDAIISASNKIHRNMRNPSITYEKLYEISLQESVLSHIDKPSSNTVKSIRHFRVWKKLDKSQRKKLEYPSDHIRSQADCCTILGDAIIRQEIKEKLTTQGKPQHLTDKYVHFTDKELLAAFRRNPITYAFTNYMKNVGFDHEIEIEGSSDTCWYVPVGINEIGISQFLKKKIDSQKYAEQPSSLTQHDIKTLDTIMNKWVKYREQILDDSLRVLKHNLTEIYKSGDLTGDVIRNLIVDFIIGSDVPFLKLGDFVAYVDKIQENLYVSRATY